MIINNFWMFPALTFAGILGWLISFLIWSFIIWLLWNLLLRKIFSKGEIGFDSAAGIAFALWILSLIF